MNLSVEICRDTFDLLFSMYLLIFFRQFSDFEYYLFQVCLSPMAGLMVLRRSDYYWFYCRMDRQVSMRRGLMDRKGRYTLLQREYPYRKSCGFEDQKMLTRRSVRDWFSCAISCYLMQVVGLKMGFLGRGVMGVWLSMVDLMFLRRWQWLALFWKQRKCSDRLRDMRGVINMWSRQQQIYRSCVQRRECKLQF